MGSQLQTLVAMYDRRAPNYDDSWHGQLAQDLVSWCKPQPGDHVLDLACGTGLITFLARQAVGESGSVVGVDISNGMLAVARSKEQQVPALTGPIVWVHHNIDADDLLERDEIRKEANFDVIYCCSAMALIPDPQKALARWSRLLRPGGRIVFDYPTEATTVMGLIVYDIPVRLGLPIDASWRAWMKGKETLEEAVSGSGLQLEKLFKSRSYIPENQYESGDWMRVFDEAITTNYKHSAVADPKVKDEARKIFVEQVKQVANQKQGVFHEGNWLYITIARSV